MAGLIVLDASVAIAALSAEDSHHNSVAAALAGAAEDELVMAATTRAEILIGPHRRGAGAVASAMAFIDGCLTVPVTAVIADAAAALRARHRTLSVPDAIAVVLAVAIDADAVWTCDRRWQSVDPRIVVL